MKRFFLNFTWSDLRKPGTIRAIITVLFWIFLFAQAMPKASVTGNDSSDSSHLNHSEQILLYIWAAVLTVLISLPLWKKQAQKHWGVFRTLRPLDFALAVPVMAMTIATGLFLRWACPWLDRSWLYLIPGNDGHATNIMVAPVTLPFIGLPFLILLTLCLPMFAYREEIKFRLGTTNWRQGIRRSLWFGLAHSLWSGIPLYGGLALTIGGLWFTFQYFKGGVERSTRHHLAYNLLIMAVVATALIYGIFTQ